MVNGIGMIRDFLQLVAIVCFYRSNLLGLTCVLLVIWRRLDTSCSVRLQPVVEWLR